MLEALWSAKFYSGGTLLGAGVVVLETGRIFGGDSQYIYTGVYDASSGSVKASVKIKHYNAAQQSVFGPGIDSAEVELTGPIAKRSFEVTGHLKYKPTEKITIKLERQAELP